MDELRAVTLQADEEFMILLAFIGVFCSFDDGTEEHLLGFSCNPWKDCGDTFF